VDFAKNKIFTKLRTVIYFGFSSKEVRILAYNLTYCYSIQMSIILFISIQ